MLHVLYNKHEQEKTALFIDRRFHCPQTVLHLSDRVPCTIRDMEGFVKIVVSRNSVSSNFGATASFSEVMI